VTLKQSLILGGILLAAAAVAQDASTLKVLTHPEAKHEVWIHPAGEPDTRDGFEAKGVSGELLVPLPEESEGLEITVTSAASGLAATAPLDNLPAGGWPTLGDWKTLASVKIAVFSDGEAVSDGEVVLKFEGGERRQPASDATFYAVPRGPIEAQYAFESGGIKVLTEPQSLGTPSPDNPTPYLLEVDVPTIGVAQPDPEKPFEGRPIEAEDDGNLAGKIIGMLLGLGLIGGIGYGIYRFVQSSPAQAKETLEKLGLDPDHQADPAAPAAAPQADKPLEKIVLSGAEVASVAAAAPVSAPNPRLVMPDGDVHLLVEDQMIVGRDESVGISFAGEMSISRTHAEIARRDDDYVIQDTGSTNGTYVNGSRLDDEHVLKPGDSIQFGSIQCRFEV
jgi:hypothetical protein